MSKRKVKRLSPDIRRDQILTAAIEVATVDGYESMSRVNVAERAGCASGQVSRIFNTMVQLRRAVMRHTVKELESTFPELNPALLSILLQGLARGESAASTASPEIKSAALGLVK